MVLRSKDQALNPERYVLDGLKACVTSAIIHHAAARGIMIGEIDCLLKEHRCSRFLRWSHLYLHFEPDVWMLFGNREHLKRGVNRLT